MNPTTDDRTYIDRLKSSFYIAQAAHAKDDGFFWGCTINLTEEEVVRHKRLMKVVIAELGFPELLCVGSCT